MDLMKASELYRKLLYKGHSELSAFFEESPLNYSLYKCLREVKPRHQINMSMVDILNEVYFICIKASRDQTPGDNVNERYITDVKTNTGSSLSTELIFCLVYMVLSTQRHIPYPLDCFHKAISQYVYSSNIWNEIKPFIDKAKLEFADFESDFTPQPVAVSELPTYSESQPQSIIESIMQEYSQQNPWRIVTGNYAHTAILDFLRCYHSLDDQRFLLERIKESSTPNERKVMEGFYKETFELIDMGEFLPRSVEQSAKTLTTQDDRKELSIAYQQIEYLKQQISDLQQSYTAKFSKQRADFDRRLSRIDAKYQSDLAANKEAIVKEKIVTSTPAEPTFTIKELVEHACSQCTADSANAITTMLYRLVGIHGFTDSKTIALIDGIIPAIEKRNAIQQNMQFPGVSQFNNNPQAVNNNYNPEKTRDNGDQD